MPTFTVLDHIPYHPEVEHWEYPKAGDTNPVVRLGIVRSAGGATTWADLSGYRPSDPLVVNVDWTPDSSHVVFQVQDREQTWLDLVLAHPEGGSVEKVLRETTEAWVNVNGPPIWLEDGTFLWLSERSGWKHLYHVDRSGTVRRTVTSGEWEVRRVHGVDEDADAVYFSGTERSPIGLDVYRVGLDGSGLRRLSEAPGTHGATFNPDLTHYIDRWSDISNPPQVRVHAADGSVARVVAANEVRALGDYDLPAPEFLQVANRDGFEMEALMIKPPDFDPSHRYPVYQHIYGGPHIQRVSQRLEPGDALLAAPRPTRHRRLGARQQHRQRQGRRLHMAGVPTVRRAGAARSGRRPRLARRPGATSTPSASASRAGATAASWSATR